MEEKIPVIYCLCDNLLKAIHHYKDHQRKMKDAEVMTTTLVGMLFFRRNFEHVRSMLGTSTYIPEMVSKSRVNRRLYHIYGLFFSSYGVLAQTWKQLNSESLYIIDSFPIPVCDNY